MGGEILNFYLDLFKSWVSSVLKDKIYEKKIILSLTVAVLTLIFDIYLIAFFI